MHEVHNFQGLPVLNQHKFGSGLKVQDVDESQILQKLGAFSEKIWSESLNLSLMTPAQWKVRKLHQDVQSFLGKNCKLICGAGERFHKIGKETKVDTLWPGIDLTKRKSDMHFFELQVEIKKNKKT